MLDAGAVVPTAIEYHDFARRREVLHVSLHVEHRLLAIGRSRQRDNAKDTRADTLRDGANRPTFTGSVAALKNDDDAEPLGLDPILQITKLGLKFAQFFLVLLALHRFGVGSI